MYQSIVSFDAQENNEQYLNLIPNKNLITGKKQFLEKFENITSLELDLLTVSSSIFACDIAFKRGDREEISRKISLTIPVTNFAAFSAIRDELTYALSILSHDAWELEFTRKDGSPEENMEWGNFEGSVLLFSGGLDSFSEAIYLGEHKKYIELVSHITANPVVKNTQEKLFEYLTIKYPQKFNRIHFYVSGRKFQDCPFPPSGQREDTQRTRSFLFLTLAALVARRKGIQEIIYIAENGQMAINLPLTAARISAFSTHTAHPEYLNVMQGILSQVLTYPIKIKNPFRYSTKSEVVKDVVQKHSSMAGETISCWKASRVRGGLNHCGECIPCLHRRIALESNGLKLPEYQTDLFIKDVAQLPSNNQGKRNLGELGEFVKLFEIGLPHAELIMIFPDLVNDFFDAHQAASMYKRFAMEAKTIFNQYPLISDFLE